MDPARLPLVASAAIHDRLQRVGHAFTDRPILGGLVQGCVPLFRRAALSQFGNRSRFRLLG